MKPDPRPSIAMRKRSTIRSCWAACLPAKASGAAHSPGRVQWRKADRSLRVFSFVSKSYSLQRPQRVASVSLEDILLIACLGLPRSATTWTFNVVRAIAAETRRDFVGVFAQTADDLAAKVPPGAANIVLKAHLPDPGLARLLSASQAPVILTWRDPRDAVVSYVERVESDVPSAIRIMTHCCCVLAEFATSHPHLLLVYEDQFCENPLSIDRIADYLGIPISPNRADEIYQALRFESVSRAIRNWSGELGPDSGFNTHVDLETHWHKDHLGDGKVGKWTEKLTKDWGRTVDCALSGLRSSNLEANHSMLLMFEWLSPMFEWGATPAAQNNFISTNSQQRLILTGPGVCLPSGRWRILFEITLSRCPDVDLKIELRFGDAIAVHRLYLVEPTSVFWLDIDHYEPSIFTFSVFRESEPTPGYIGIARIRAVRRQALAASRRQFGAHPANGRLLPKA
jgi:Sulfotransferase domain